MHDDDYLVIIGIAYTPAPDHDCVMFHKHEMSVLADALVGIGVYIEHDADDKKKMVGNVRHAFVTKNNNVVVIIIIENSVMYYDEYNTKYIIDNRNVRENLYYYLSNNILKGLSVGHNASILSLNNVHKVVKKTPVELSIVQVGDRPGTHIISFFNMKDITHLLC